MLGALATIIARQCQASLPRRRCWRHFGADTSSLARIDQAQQRKFRQQPRHRDNGMQPHQILHPQIRTPTGPPLYVTCRRPTSRELAEEVRKHPNRYPAETCKAVEEECERLVDTLYILDPKMREAQLRSAYNQTEAQLDAIIEIRRELAILSEQVASLPKRGFLW